MSLPAGIEIPVTAVLNGYGDGTFRPEAEITRAGMAVMIAAALKLEVDASAVAGFADDEGIPLWARGTVARLKGLGFMEGKGMDRFDSHGKAMRAEVVKVLLGMLKVTN